MSGLRKTNLRVRSRLGSAAAIGVLCFLFLGSIVAAPAVAQSDESWQWSGALYLWAADVGGKTKTGTEIDVSFSDLVDDLEWGFLGSLGARKGRWSVFADLVVLDIGKTEQTIIEGPIEGIVNIPAEVDFGLQSWVVHAAGGYSLLQSDSGSRLDVIFGTRFLDLDMDLVVALDAPLQERRREFTEGGNVWDAIVGVRGNIALGKRFSIPYLLDVGTGQSDLTWQALGGLTFQTTSWLDLALAYRYIEWEFESDSIIADLNFSGPAFGLIFRF